MRKAFIVDKGRQDEDLPVRKNHRQYHESRLCYCLRRV